MRNKIVFDKEGAGSYKWDEYDVKSGDYYSWNKFNINAVNNYQWKKYNVEQDTHNEYNWGKYILNSEARYHSWVKQSQSSKDTFSWSKYNIIPAGTVGYTWSKSNPKYTWNRYEKVSTTGSSDVYTVNSNTNIYQLQNSVISYDENGLIISNFNINNEKESFCNYKMIVTPGTLNATISNYKILLHFYSQCTINPSTGAKIYSGMPQYEGNGIYATYVPAYYYDKSAGTTVKLTAGKKWSDLDSEDIIFYEGDGITQFYLSNNYINIVDYPYMEMYPIVNGSSGYNVYNINEAVIKSMNTSIMRDVYGGWVLPEAWLPSIVYLKDATTSAAAFSLTNVTANSIVKNVNASSVPFTQGKFIDTITSTNASAYPTNGYDANYWYVYAGVSAGTFIETVTSTSSSAYPTDNILNGYYYGNKGSFTSTSPTKSAYVGIVNSTVDTAYPLNGVQSGYWYVYNGQTVSNTLMKTAIYIDIDDTTNQVNIPVNTIIYASSAVPSYVEGAKKFTMSSYTTRTISASNYTTVLSTLFQGGYAYIMIGSKDGTIYYQLTSAAALDSSYNMHEISKYTIQEYYGTNVSYGNYLGKLAKNSSYFQTAASGLVYSKGAYLNDVKSNVADAYPQSDRYNGYWYEYINSNSVLEDVKGGTYQGYANSNNINEYPNSGSLNGVWYEYDTFTVSLTKGNSIEVVYSDNDEEYPTAGVYNNYYYSYIGSNSGYYRDIHLQSVYSPTSNTYPINGYQNGFWYVYKGYTNQTGEVISDAQIVGGVSYKHEVNPDEDFTIGVASAASITFVMNTPLMDTQKYVGKSCNYYSMQGDNKDWRLIGKFIITNCEEKTKFTTKVSGYDLITKFDTYVDEWIETVTFPISLKLFFESLCTYCGCNAVTTDFINSDFIINDNFTGTRITGRDILQYIAQASAAFAHATPNGAIELKSYNYTGTVLTNSEFVDLKNSVFITEPIDKLNIQMTEDDVGTTSGTGTNAYYITNNPLFYAGDASYNQQACDNIYNALKQVSYTPATVSLLQDFNIECGDIITVNNKNVYVMSKEINSSGVKLSCSGNQSREVASDTINSEITALRGKTNELTRTIEETKSTITDVEQELQSQITQTADTITAEVLKQGDVVTSIKQGLDGINLTYNSAQGTASITIGDITISNLVNESYVKQVVAGVTLTGYVQFSDLSGNGTSVINGSNITTGTISAERINLSGAISWSDLDGGCQSTIASFGGDGTVPEYIHSTYIDSTTIYSPTIYGATITAGTSAKGYVELSSTGMNFCSKTSGALAGIGYYAGNYNYPYVVLGSGVDDAGTDRGMIKKYSNGIWIGDSDNLSSATPGGTGIFVNFTTGKFYKYVNGTATQF